MHRAHAVGIPAALAFVYFAWGSSYLATRFGVETVSPWEFAAVRMSLVGPIMFGVALLLRQSLPGSARDWAIVLGTGFMMMVAASGTVAWAQQWVPSGEAALIMSGSALFTAWFGTWGLAGDAVGKTVSVALIVGVVGIALLIGMGRYHGGAPLWSYLGMVLAAMAWSGASIILRRFPVDCGATMIIAIQCSLAALCFGLCVGVLDQPPSIWTARSYMALGYHVIFGSVLGYAAYYWLLPRISPSLLGTISFVNPAVALLIGHVIAGERLSPTQYSGAILVLCSVVIVGLGLRLKRRGSVRTAIPVVQPKPNAS